MELDKYTIYRLRKSIDDLGNLFGEIYIVDERGETYHSMCRDEFCFQNMDSPYNARYVDIDFDKLKGFEEYKGRMHIEFNPPKSMPGTGSMYRDNDNELGESEFEQCVGVAYEILNEVLKREKGLALDIKLDSKTADILTKKH